MVIAQEKIELERREARYRQDRPAPDLRGRVVILVDDGLATGATMRAAAAALRKQGVAKIVVAVPVGAPETCQELDSEVDEVICAFMPEFFHGVGQFYEDFSQTTDEEVRELLAKAKDQFEAIAALPKIADNSIPPRLPGRRRMTLIFLLPTSKVSRPTP